MKPELFISKYESQVYSILRIAVGFLFLWHGSQKLLALPQAGIIIPVYVIFIAGPIELFGGFLVMIGLWTRWAAFICSGEMAYAYWSVYGTNVVLPLLNGGELAMLYCFLFLFISARGSGSFSVENLLREKRKGQAS
jgi:putative oxidoreductase